MGVVVYGQTDDIDERLDNTFIAYLFSSKRVAAARPAVATQRPLARRTNKNETQFVTA